MRPVWFGWTSHPKEVRTISTLSEHGSKLLNRPLSPVLNIATVTKSYPPESRRDWSCGVPGRLIRFMGFKPKFTKIVCQPPSLLRNLLGQKYSSKSRSVILLLSKKERWMGLIKLHGGQRIRFIYLPQPKWCRTGRGSLNLVFTLCHVDEHSFWVRRQATGIILCLRSAHRSTWSIWEYLTSRSFLL